MVSDDSLGRRRIYRWTSPFKILMPAIVTLIISLVIIAVTIESKDRIIVLYMAGIFVVIVGIVYWIMSLTKLEVSSNGITYHSVGYKVHSTWPNIQGYGQRLMGATDVECLILRESGLKMSWWMRVGQAVQPIGQVAGALQGQYIPGVNMDNYSIWIPVSIYALNWRLSELGDTIRRYAPEAFDNELPR